MRTSRIIPALAALVLLAGVSNAQNKFTGTKACAMCHKSGKGGTSYAVWEKSAHAGAYKTLLGEQAMAIAKAKGLKNAPGESPECLRCHVTGGGAAENIETTFRKEDGIGCETCHGAASAYKTLHSKGDLKKSMAAGMSPGTKDEKLCLTCHNADSPTFKGFKFAEMWKKMEHTLPVK